MSGRGAADAKKVEDAMKLVQMTPGMQGKPFLSSLLLELSLEFGAKIFVDSEYGYVGYIEFASGRRSFFRNTTFDINPNAASAIAKDKDYCAVMLRHFGYPVPDGVVLFSPKYRHEMRLKNEAIAAGLGFAEKASIFAEEHGFPLFLKPNDGSEGRGVTKVYTIDELFDALWRLFEDDEMILLQKAVQGRDFRVVVLYGEVVSAYERIAFGAVGDGESDLETLVRREIARLRANSRGAKVRADDPRMAAEMMRQNLSRNSVIAPGRRVTLLPNANLSAGGQSVDLTDRIHPSFKEMAERVTRDLGLNLAGIDVLAPDICAPLAEYCVLEVNSAPGLNNFAGSSADSNARTRALYRRLFTKLSEG
jgi:D-alanine-D-alanine ligase-like ATP-grasp enzyme